MGGLSACAFFCFVVGSVTGQSIVDIYIYPTDTCGAPRPQDIDTSKSSWGAKSFVTMTCAPNTVPGGSGYYFWQARLPLSPCLCARSLAHVDN